MWAHRLVAPGVLEQVEVATPEPESLLAGGVLLRTLAGGICGSDIPRFLGLKYTVPGPRGRFGTGIAGFPMHETVGEVLASRHQDVAVGALVVGWAALSDGLAQYLVTDGEQVLAYDEGLAPTTAVLVQSLACVLYAMKRVDVAGRQVAVIGLGPIGLMFAHVARHLGAARVTAVDPVDRQPVAAAFGIDECLVTPSAPWSTGLAADERPDVTIEAVGHQVGTLNDALHATAVGGTVLYFGIPDNEYYPVDMESIMRKNLALVGGITRDRRRSLAEADDYLRRYPELAPLLITHAVERSGVQSAFDLARYASPDRIKIVLDLAS